MVCIFDFAINDKIVVLLKSAKFQHLDLSCLKGNMVSVCMQLNVLFELGDIPLMNVGNTHHAKDWEFFVRSKLLQD